MPHINSNRRKPAIAALVLLLACLVLAACGSSSKSSTTTTTATTSASTSAKGAGASRFTALRECLQKNGITLPTRTPGKRPSGGPTGKGGAGGFLGGGAAGGGGPKLPSGVTRAQYEAAIKKCGGGSFAGGKSRFDSPAYKEALTKFASCMRENGVNVPTPNTSGSGPVFDTKGLDTSSSQFKTAESKCRSDLLGAFRHSSSRGGPPGGAPPSGEASTG